MELLQDAEFLPRVFKLNRQCPPPVTPDVADAIGLKYQKFSLQAKIIFHMEQVKFEIACLKILTTHNCRCSNELELESKYFRRLEEIQAKETSILIAIRKQQRDFCHEVGNRSGALDEPVIVDFDNNAITK